MKTLADFKRLPEGVTLELFKAVDFDGTDWSHHKGMNTPRQIMHKQTNAIKFFGGSWLEYPKASDCKVHGDIIEIYDPNSKMELHYRIVRNNCVDCGVSTLWANQCDKCNEQMITCAKMGVNYA